MTGQSEKPHRISREGLSEYLIVVALLILAAVGALAVFGQDIREIFGAPAQARSADPAAPAAPSHPEP